MNKIEIMSPVGSYESLTAAIQGGADAIYFGVGKLNMRAQSAVNFQVEDLKKIKEICQIHGVKTYLTLNTIIYADEIEEMQQLLDEAKATCIDAVIASDWAVIHYARQIGMEIHISTQCNITNIEAVKHFSQYADVMVTARELSLKQVAEIVRQIELQNIRGPKGELVQIEIFAHGALCMAVSGKCYLSLDHYNRSANRGACLQLCRRPYRLSEIDTDENPVEIEVDQKYLLSPKDLKTLDFIDKILKAGVRVLKIEGRGRSADYVKTVTRIYKEAVTAYQEGNYTPERIAEWNKSLSTVYNRGFWSGYYLGKTMGEWSEQYGSKATKKKVAVGKITNYFSNIGVAEVKMESEQLELGNDYMVVGPTSGVYEDQVHEMRLDLKLMRIFYIH